MRLYYQICYVYWEKDKGIQHIWNARWIVNIIVEAWLYLLPYNYSYNLNGFFCFIQPQMASPCYLDWMANWHRGNLNIVGCNIACFWNVLCVTFFSIEMNWGLQLFITKWWQTKLPFPLFCCFEEWQTSK
jgi:hypothetical protein